MELFDTITDLWTYTIEYMWERFWEVDVTTEIRVDKVIAMACYDVLKETNDIEKEDVIWPTVLTAFFDVIEWSIPEEKVKEILSWFNIYKK